MSFVQAKIPADFFKQSVTKEEIQEELDLWINSDADRVHAILGAHEPLPFISARSRRSKRRGRTGRPKSV